MDEDIVIVEATRSIIGSANGSLQDLGPAELGIPIMESLLARVESKSKKFNRDMVDHFACGLCVGAGIGQNLPRQIGHKTGLNKIRSAFVVNEMCGSGMEAIILGIQPLKLGEADIAIVGGVEAVSQSPYLLSTKELIEWKDLRVEEIQEKVKKADLYDALWDKMFDVHTIVHAENSTRTWAEKNNYNFEKLKLDIDDYALLSHERARQAIADGMFKDEITVIEGTSEHDENPARKSIKIMNKRKGTQFTPDGVFLSNHNSPPLANNATFMMLMRHSKAKELGLQPMARIHGYAKGGVVPENFLLAPLDAIETLMEQTNVSVGDYDLVESNSAFGSQMIINKETFGLDMERTNIYGDCVALGHPIGAAGARILTTLMYGLRRQNKKLGMAAICLGGGNGLAMSIESM